VFAVEPLADLDQNLARPRFYAAAVLFFAVFSLFLAAAAVWRATRIVLKLDPMTVLRAE
jgi:hypothetical protein